MLAQRRRSRTLNSHVLLWFGPFICYWPSRFAVKKADLLSPSGWPRRAFSQSLLYAVAEDQWRHGSKGGRTKKDMERSLSQNSIEQSQNSVFSLLERPLEILAK